jgi:hypothetical protein
VIKRIILLLVATLAGYIVYRLTTGMLMLALEALIGVAVSLEFM